MNVKPDAAPPANDIYLWLVASGPVVWAAHFLLSYITASVWCARFADPDGTLGPVHAAIGWYTVVALLAIGLLALGGFRRHGKGFGTEEHERDTPMDRHRFLGFAALLLAGLSAVATIYAAVSVLFIERCY